MTSPQSKPLRHHSEHSQRVRGAVFHFELDQEQVITAERDRMLELRVKFNVEGMHGVLTHEHHNR